MAKYDDLAKYLAAVDGTAVTMEFAEVDAVVGGLPPSAREYRTWWGNSRRQSQSKAWLAAGWRVDAVNLTSETVTFARTDAGAGFAPKKRAARSRERPVPESEVGLFEVSIRATWERWGPVQLDDSGRLLFPDVPDEAGVYRLWLHDKRRTVGLYIGEGQSLRRRLRNYRSPGAGQKTSLRISALLIEHLRDGEIAIDAATRAELLQAGRWVDADLTRKSDRVLVEHAELVRARDQESCEIHNL